MCGRFMLQTPEAELRALFAFEPGPPLTARYNVAPTQPVAVVRAGANGRRRLALLRWGLLPRRRNAPVPGPPIINARSETAAERPPFRDALRSRRCIVLADGFYEWASADGKKTPMLFRLRGGAPFAFAGLWEAPIGPAGKPLESCVILTTAPNELVARAHDRMPAILPPEEIAAWLDPAPRDPACVLPLLRPFPAAGMTVRAVGPRVNSPRNDGPDCAAPA
jgi:putative SOS response-associated peptidase YedK